MKCTEVEVTIGLIFILLVLYLHYVIIKANTYSYLLALLMKMADGTAENNSKQLNETSTKIYWNIPTFQCAPHKVNFTSLAKKYKIIQNEDDHFRGEKIAILYDPGSFPAILKEGRKTVLRNGGVPQEGNLTWHLEAFKEVVEELIPDQNFSGVAIIDFESWRPIFRQNFGTLSEYKNLSINVEGKLHPTWSKAWLVKEATRKFENSGRLFMEKTLILAKILRPNATWGYYGYPQCFNMSPNNMKKECPKEVIMENTRESWLYEITDNLYPSLYLGNLRLNHNNKIQMIEGRLEESQRIQSLLSHKKSLNIVPYFWYKYHDTTEFLSKDDLFSSLISISTYNLDGLILWGSSNDVNTRQKCLQLYQYINNTLGPLLLHIFE